MKRCVTCLRPDTLPGVVFNKEGVCPACERFADRSRIDYAKRKDFLKKLCDEHRRSDGTYDCIIPVSGGKDSFFQVHVLKHEHGMNPLLVCVTDPFTHTPEGTHNYTRIAKAFECDMITGQLNPARIARSSLMTLDKTGSTNWDVDRAIYAWPLTLAIAMGIKLIVYGENVSWEYGGPNAEDTFSAEQQIKNNVVRELSEDAAGIRFQNMLRYPTAEEFDQSKLQPIYLSWFLPWNDHVNVMHATHYGFRVLKSMKRAGYIDDYAQIDSIGYLFNYYLKFMKFGIGRVVDIGSRWVRYGAFNKEKLRDAIREFEGSFDLAIAADFCRMAGKEWDEIKPMVSKWWNRDIFDVAEGSMEWKWKDSGL
jgi:N-acetyl sugar amidotransferase